MLGDPDALAQAIEQMLLATSYHRVEKLRKHAASGLVKYLNISRMIGLYRDV